MSSQTGKILHSYTRKCAKPTCLVHAYISYRNLIIRFTRILLWIRLVISYTLYKLFFHKWYSFLLIGSLNDFALYLMRIICMEVGGLADYWMLITDSAILYSTCSWKMIVPSTWFLHFVKFFNFVFVPSNYKWLPKNRKNISYLLLNELSKNRSIRESLIYCRIKY